MFSTAVDRSGGKRYRMHVEPDGRLPMTEAGDRQETQDERETLERPSRHRHRRTRGARVALKLSPQPRSSFADRRAQIVSTSNVAGRAPVGSAKVSARIGVEGLATESGVDAARA
jgi:hypothetical protein